LNIVPSIERWWLLEVVLPSQAGSFGVRDRPSVVYKLSGDTAGVSMSM